MTNDPIVEEVRDAGEAYLRQFEFDIKSACEDLRKRTEEARTAGRNVVSFPAKRLIVPPKPEKKAG